MKPFFCTKKEDIGERCETQCELCINSEEKHKEKSKLAIEKRRKFIDYSLTMFWLLFSLVLGSVMQNKWLCMFIIIFILLGVMKLSEHNNQS